MLSCSKTNTLNYFVNFLSKFPHVRMRLYLCVLCFISFLAVKGQDSLSAVAAAKKKTFGRDDYIMNLADMINIAPFVFKSTTGFTLSGEKNIQYQPNEGV